MRAFLNRPDHLTRAAMELSRFAEVENDVRALTLSPDIIVAAITIGTHVQPAVLVTRGDAARVAHTIHVTVERVREAEAAARRFE
jgi:microcompartment protein CcmK/EutM